MRILIQFRRNRMYTEKNFKSKKELKAAVLAHQIWLAGNPVAQVMVTPRPVRCRYTRQPLVYARAK
jgi:hypothetical protein